MSELPMDDKGALQLQRDVAITALNFALEALNYAGLQLSHANGLIDSEAFARLTEEYLKFDKWDDAELALNIRVLRYMVNGLLDDYTVSTLLHCEINQVHRVLWIVGGDGSVKRGETK